jgi:acyl carrier protein
MDNTEARLTNCFSAIFPELTDEQIHNATSTTVRGWDSVAGVTLIAVVEEEFGVNLDSDELSRLISFRGFLNCLRDMEFKQGANDVGSK